MDVADNAYKNKVDAIESSNVQTMKQASSYFTEVVAAFAAMSHVRDCEKVREAAAMF